MSETITVKQLNTYIKAVLDSEEYLRNVCVLGEVSNFTNHSSGHWYLSLKDDSAVIKAVMFKSSAVKVDFVPKNGDKVIVTGRVSVFEASGQYQLYIESMKMFGVGDLFAKFEKLKQDLFKEGLFDERHKKPLPKIPLKIGVITSPTGAAVRDIINILNRRFPLAEVILYPALVQGETAYISLIDGVNYFNTSNSVDVIIIGRGGGSIEDLWPFNNEMLARCIYSSHIPIVSAVGHEIDFTICDFVCDLRAPTPSAAAELVVPSSEELVNKFENLKNHLLVLLTKSINLKRQKLNMLENSQSIKNPMLYIDKKREKIDYEIRLLVNAANNVVNKNKNKFVSYAAALNSLSPLNALKRGYTLATYKSKIVKSVKDVDIDYELDLKYIDGKIKTKIINIESEI